MDQSVRRLFTVEQMAEDLNVPKSWIYGQTRLKGENRIPYLRVGKYVRFDPLEVRAWLIARGKRE